MVDLEKHKKYFLLFVEMGFIAVNQADEDAALKLFKTAEILNPENSFPKIGLGYLHLHKLELKQACKLFEEVLSKEPTNEMAKTLLGISLSMTPDKGIKGEKILQEAVNKADDPAIKTCASTALSFVDKFIKKSKSPMEVKKEEK